MGIRNTHIPFEQLADVVEGHRQLDEHENEHLSSCSTCSADVLWLQNTLGLMRTDQSIDPPAHLVTRAVHAFYARFPRGAPSSPLRRVMAALRFDSAQSPMAVGVRAGQAAPRQLLYSAEEHDLDLRITPNDARWTVSGQVFGPVSGGSVELVGPSSTVRTGIDELHEFALPPVPAGSYTLRVRFQDVEAEVPQLDLGA